MIVMQGIPRSALVIHPSVNVFKSMNYMHCMGIVQFFFFL